MTFKAAAPAGHLRAAVIIPTYNERENLQLIVGRLRRAVPDADVLIVDDNSPDGTGDVADLLATHDSRVHVLHRSAKEGLGAAYLAGFGWALDRGYEAIVEMDADGSHQPEQLPDLLTALAEADLVIASRWTPGGRVVNWPKSRQMLSRYGNTYTRLILRIGIRDATAGYRAYRASALRQIGLNDVASQGYCFQVDLARRTLRAGLTVLEWPITFVGRTHGDSKMNLSIIGEALVRIACWGLFERRRSRDYLIATRDGGNSMMTPRRAAFKTPRSSAEVHTETNRRQPVAPAPPDGP